MNLTISHSRTHEVLHMRLVYCTCVAMLVLAVFPFGCAKSGGVVRKDPKTPSNSGSPVTPKPQEPATPK